MPSTSTTETCPCCDEIVAGSVCPSCGAVLTTAPHPAADLLTPPVEPRNCPYCDVAIQPLAALCPSCGSLLPGQG